MFTKPFPGSEFLIIENQPQYSDESLLIEKLINHTSRKNLILITGAYSY